MNEAIIQNWNAVVKPNDTVYVVGDIIMGKSTEIDKLLKVLQGQKVLVIGNHDKQRLRFLRPFMKEVHKSLDFEFEGKEILVRHKPMYDALPIQYDLQICGHVHEKWKTGNRMVNVGVDVWDFKPVLVEAVVDYYSQQKLALT
jgi:calcineurin-like phosphoesterase family protein